MLPLATLDANGRSGLVNGHRSGTHTERPVSRGWSASPDPKGTVKVFESRRSCRKLKRKKQPFENGNSNFRLNVSFEA